MFIEQFYTKCLSQYAYYIESHGEVAIIDPVRNTEPYMQLAKKRGATIKYVLETHIPSDFISGDLDITRETAAKIILGPNANASFEFYSGKDDEEFKLGNNVLKLLHTPGLTPEACCFLLLDENKNPHSLFSGDTLLVNDVGMPEIRIDYINKLENLLGDLFESIQLKIKPLPNYVVLYPGHANADLLSSSTAFKLHSTIGIQKQLNSVFKLKSMENFIKLVKDNFNEVAANFDFINRTNRQVHVYFNDILERNLRSINLVDFEKFRNTNKCTIIDSRPIKDFEKAFIPGSFSFALNGPFSRTVGDVIVPTEKIIVVCEAGFEKETIVNLANIGYDHVVGYLSGGFENWATNSKINPDTISSVSATEFEEQYRYNVAILIDVRNENEWISGFVAGTKLISISELKNRLPEIDHEKVVYIYCSSGYRSMVAASILKANGFKKVFHIRDGLLALKKTNMVLKHISAKAI